jgi:peptide chain release factor 1
MKVLRARLRDGTPQRGSHRQVAADRLAPASARKIRFSFPEPLTDHRINFTTHRIGEVLNGDIVELLDNVSMHYQAEKLKDATAVS